MSPDPLTLQICDPVAYFALSFVLGFAVLFALVGLSQKLLKRLNLKKTPGKIAWIIVCLPFVFGFNALLQEEGLCHFGRGGPRYFYKIDRTEDGSSINLTYSSPDKVVSISAKDIEEVEIIGQPCLFSPGTTKVFVQILRNGEDSGKRSDWLRLNSEKSFDDFKAKVSELAKSLGKPLAYYRMVGDEGQMIKNVTVVHLSDFAPASH